MFVKPWNSQRFSNWGQKNARAEDNDPEAGTVHEHLEETAHLTTLGKVFWWVESVPSGKMQGEYYAFTQCKKKRPHPDKKWWYNYDCL